MLKFSQNDFVWSAWLWQVKDSLGAPLKGYGETSARGRRRHIRFRATSSQFYFIHMVWLTLFFSHLEYQKDGCDYMRMQFNVEGSRQKGKVLLEMKKVYLYKSSTSSDLKVHITEGNEWAKNNHYDQAIYYVFPGFFWSLWLSVFNRWSVRQCWNNHHCARQSLIVWGPKSL